jgi:hypothetical protein
MTPWRLSVSTTSHADSGRSATPLACRSADALDRVGVFPHQAAARDLIENPHPAAGDAALRMPVLRRRLCRRRRNDLTRRLSAFVCSAYVQGRFYAHITRFFCDGSRAACIARLRSNGLDINRFIRNSITGTAFERDSEAMVHSAIPAQPRAETAWLDLQELLSEIGHLRRC